MSKHEDEWKGLKPWKGFKPWKELTPWKQLEFEWNKFEWDTIELQWNNNGIATENIGETSKKKQNNSEKTK